MSSTPGAAAPSSSKSKATGSSQAPEKRKPLFQKELQHMMYGFGDEQNVSFSSFLHHISGYYCSYKPLPETVALVEDIVVEYVTDLRVAEYLYLLVAANRERDFCVNAKTHKAQEIGTKRGRLLVDDFLYLIRKDLPKLNRCRELLAMQEELKQARKAFDVDEEKITSLD
ncbi:hypothetical protein YC2023_121251 [Brassica napus]